MMLVSPLTSWLKYYLNIILMEHISHCIRDFPRDCKYLGLVVHSCRLILYKKGYLENFFIPPLTFIYLQQCDK